MNPGTMVCLNAEISYFLQCRSKLSQYNRVIVQAFCQAYNFKGQIWFNIKTESTSNFANPFSDDVVVIAAPTEGDDSHDPEDIFIEEPASASTSKPPPPNPTSKNIVQPT